MNRLASLPHHKLTAAIAVCMAILTVLGALDGSLGWSFWLGLAMTAALAVIAVREKRRAA